MQLKFPPVSIIKKDRGAVIAFSIKDKTLQLTTALAFLPALSSSKVTSFAALISSFASEKGRVRGIDFAISAIFVGFRSFYPCDSLYLLIDQSRRFYHEALDVLSREFGVECGVDLVGGCVVDGGFLVLLQVGVDLPATVIQIRTLELLQLFLLLALPIYRLLIRLQRIIQIFVVLEVVEEVCQVGVSKHVYTHPSTVTPRVAVCEIDLYGLVRELNAFLYVLLFLLYCDVKQFTFLAHLLNNYRQILKRLFILRILRMSQENYTLVGGLEALPRGLHVPLLPHDLSQLHPRLVVARAQLHLRLRSPYRLRKKLLRRLVVFLCPQVRHLPAKVNEGGS